MEFFIGLGIAWAGFVIAWAIDTGLHEVAAAIRSAASNKCLVRLCNAIKEAIEEMERCPDDSIQDIWNEKLDEWQTGLRMDIHHNIEPNTSITELDAKTGATI